MIAIQRSTLMVLFLAIINLSLQSQDLLKFLPESLPKSKVNQLLRPDHNHQKREAAEPVLQHLKDSVKFFTYADPNNPTCEEISTYEYDAWGNLILSTEYYWHGSLAVMVPSFKNVYAYNMKGLLIIDTTFTWLMDLDEWREYELFEYEYNDAGKEIYFHQYEWDSQASEFKNYIRIETSYDANDDSEIAIMSLWNPGLSIWENSFRMAYTHNSNHSMLTRLSFIWDDGLEDWENFQRESYEYDAEEHNTVILSEYWNRSLSTWDTVQKMEMVYNSSGLKEIVHNFYWDPAQSEWDPESRYEYMYYEDGKLYAYLYLPWDEAMGAFLVESQSGYTYDSYGNQITVTADTVDEAAHEMVLTYRIYSYYSHLYHVVEFMSICDQDSLEWQGSYLKTEGVHTVSYSSVQGYDSLYTMYLFIDPKPDPFSITGEESVTPGQVEVYTVPENAGVIYAWSVSNATALSYPDAHSIEIEWINADEGYVRCLSINEFDCNSGVMELIVDILNTAIPGDLSEVISLYPNPVQEVLHLSIPDKYHMKRILLLDALGRCVLQSPVTENKMSLELSQLTPGVYFLRFEGKNTFQYSIIKQ
ncbi:MAG: hypothetical protein DRJ29_13750 [Bacteroidetes bacterium]|nr:MAG: hypothetical protein DRI98_11050 [Bacteroidota bacterium]RLD91699.1 MAG: hypothetical protein DRJ29_13750 [Bacteroidota bacterium]